MKAVANYYENNDEDSRISTNKARKVEFIISSKILDEYINPQDKIIDDGIIRDGEEDCFWTDAFFTSPTEIEEFLSQFNIDIIDHVAVDGLSPLLRSSIDDMSDEEYEIWINYQLKTCRERSIRGISNHGLVICKKR